MTAARPIDPLSKPRRGSRAVPDTRDPRTPAVPVPPGHTWRPLGFTPEPDTTPPPTHPRPLSPSSTRRGGPVTVRDESKSLTEKMTDSDDPADVVAQAIFSGAWFPPDPRDTDDEP